MKKIIKNILFKKSAKGHSDPENNSEENDLKGENMIDEKKHEDLEAIEKQEIQESAESLEQDADLEKEIFESVEENDEADESEGEQDSRPMHLSVEDEDDFLRASSEEGAQDSEGEDTADDFEESQARHREQNDRSKKYTNARELLTEEVPFRVQRANDRLKTNLAGSIVFEIDNNEKYLFDWSTSNLKVEKTEDSGADCFIKISDQNLMKVASGELNPQVAMLSDKISVSGRLGLAIYIFNLIAPRQFMH